MGWVLELHQTGPAGREPAETSLISRDQGTRREEEARPGQGKTGKTEIQAHPGTMATLPSAASPSWQPLGPEDEDASLDQYDLYSLAHPYIVGGGRKGRTKREAAANTNRPSPGGHERKLVTKFQNSERKKARR
uniref:Nuclear protein 1 n=1 Tax=Castor canadensis TaxID=51338 RepID=A0A8C0VUJ4_CASCN|nr:nuclear protein 1 [Castor canadensis]